MARPRPPQARQIAAILPIISILASKTDIFGGFAAMARPRPSPGKVDCGNLADYFDFGFEN